MPKIWYTERQLRGLQAQVQAGINRCADGAYVELDLTTAQKLVHALEQARHVERNHEAPQEGR